MTDVVTPPTSPVSRERSKEIKRLSVISTARQVRLLSRAELTELTGLSPATLTPLVRELIAEGYLIERGPGASRTGRPRAMLEFNPRAELVAAVSLEPSRISCEIADSDGDGDRPPRGPARRRHRRHHLPLGAGARRRRPAGAARGGHRRARRLLRRRGPAGPLGRPRRGAADGGVGAAAARGAGGGGQRRQPDGGRRARRRRRQRRRRPAAAARGRRHRRRPGARRAGPPGRRRGRRARSASCRWTRPTGATTGSARSRPAGRRTPSPSGWSRWPPGRRPDSPVADLVALAATDAARRRATWTTCSRPGPG